MPTSADASYTIGDGPAISAADRFLVRSAGCPHVESGMVTVTEFVRAVAPRGTTGMFVDPAKSPTSWAEGRALMVDEAADQPVHVWVRCACVPSAPGLGTPGASIGGGGRRAMTGLALSAWAR